MNDDTLVVGGAGYNSSAGTAYVFTVSRSGVFQADQRIENPDEVRHDLRKTCFLCLCHHRM